LPFGITSRGSPAVLELFQKLSEYLALHSLKTNNNIFTFPADRRQLVPVLKFLYRSHCGTPVAVPMVVRGFRLSSVEKVTIWLSKYLLFPGTREEPALINAVTKLQA
jgi:hypothetical protein